MTDLNLLAGQGPQKTQKRLTTLFLADGWGMAAANAGNAITMAKAPVFSDLMANYPIFSLATAGWPQRLDKFGLYRLLSSGLVPKIDNSFNTADLKSEILKKALQRVKKYNSVWHLVIDTSSDYAEAVKMVTACLDLAKRKKITKVALHIIADGEVLKNDKIWEAWQNDYDFVVLASIIDPVVGTNSHLDWSKTAVVYEALVRGLALTSTDLFATLREQRVAATMVAVDQYGTPSATIKNDDLVLLITESANNLLQLSTSLTEESFANFNRALVVKPEVLAICPIGNALPIATIKNFQVETKNIFDEEADLKIGYLMDTNSGAEILDGWRNRGVLKSNETAVWFGGFELADWQQSAQAGWEQLVKTCDFIVVASGRLEEAASAGDVALTIATVEAVDQLLGVFSKAVLDADGQFIFSSAVAWVEELIDVKTDQVNLLPSRNPVPLLLVSEAWAGQNLGGAETESVLTTDTIFDFAPTLAEILNIKPVVGGEGKSLL